MKETDDITCLEKVKDIRREERVREKKDDGEGWGRKEGIKGLGRRQREGSQNRLCEGSVRENNKRR
jgi:hypothetical protein